MVENQDILAVGIEDGRIRAVVLIADGRAANLPANRHPVAVTQLEIRILQHRPFEGFQRQAAAFHRPVAFGGHDGEMGVLVFESDFENPLERLRFARAFNPVGAAVHPSFTRAVRLLVRPVFRIQTVFEPFCRGNGRLDAQFAVKRQCDPLHGDGPRAQ